MDRRMLSPRTTRRGLWLWHALQLAMSCATAAAQSTISAEATLRGKVGLTYGHNETVLPGHFYPGPYDLPEPLGFRDGSSQQAVIVVDPNSAEYLFPESVELGWECQGSWNKLFGSSRCGYFQFHHEDSDRFVWRRRLECIEHSKGRVTGTVPQCKYSGQLDIAAYAQRPASFRAARSFERLLFPAYLFTHPPGNAAADTDATALLTTIGDTDSTSSPNHHCLITFGSYAYDAGNRPMGNSSLWTKFATPVNVSQPFGVHLLFAPSSTSYTLLDAAGTALESHTIRHRECGADYLHGYNLGWYFGGQCAAPQAVSTNYVSTA